MFETKIIFDIDGTIIDTSASYLEAIKVTAEFFLKKNISLETVKKIKALPGFNNDWQATYALINAELTKEDYQVFSVISQEKEKINYEEIKKVFQYFYLGEVRFKEEYPDNHELRLNDSRGFYLREKLLIPKSKLSELAERYGSLSIITGRTYAEAVFGLKQFQIIDFFKEIISVEDIKDQWFENYSEFIRFGKQKENPILFFQLKDITKYKSIYYIGDSASDEALVNNARNYLSVNFVKV